jgi:hypothetical protein
LIEATIALTVRFWVGCYATLFDLPALVCRYGTLFVLLALGRRYGASIGFAALTPS